jgi:hypothetical protein
MGIQEIYSKLRDAASKLDEDAAPKLRALLVTLGEVIEELPGVDAEVDAGLALLRAVNAGEVSGELTDADREATSASEELASAIAALGGVRDELSDVDQKLTTVAGLVRDWTAGGGR